MLLKASVYNVSIQCELSCHKNSQLSGQNQPLYGQNQFMIQNCGSCGTEMSFDLSRSKSATAVLNSQNGIFHAKPYDIGSSNEEIPPPRPPLPTNYVEESSKYFLSLPRDWRGLAKSASYSTMLY